MGYKLIEAEKRGTKIKKKLDIDPVGAETVRLIFKLYLCGNGSSGALGVKEIVKWLNARGYRTRRSKSFGVGQAHKLLTNSIYIGRWKFNQALSKTRKRKAENEIVEIPVPHIVETDTFEQVRRQLHVPQPKETASACHDRPNSAYGIGGVCNLSRWHDAAHRYLERGPSVSVLHLLQLRD